MTASLWILTRFPFHPCSPWAPNPYETIKFSNNLAHLYPSVKPLPPSSEAIIPQGKNDSQQILYITTLRPCPHALPAPLEWELCKNIMFFIYAKFTSFIGMCLFQASTVFKKVASVWTHCTIRWQFKKWF